MGKVNMEILSRKHLIRATWLLMMTIIATMTISSQTLAQEGARVYLQPLDSADGQLTVDVVTENVTDMYGAEVRLKYDQTILTVQDADPNKEGIQIEGGTLLPVDKGFVVANTVDEATGTIVFAITLLNPAPPVTGSGPLARVTFNILQTGPSTIDIERAKLVAVDLQTIPSQTVPLAIGAEAQQPTEANAVPTQAGTPLPATASTSTPSFPWWIVAAGIMVLGILGLGALVVVSGLSKPQKTGKPQPNRTRQSQSSQSQTTPQQPGQQPAGHVQGTRPSAFK
jgi:hypothetical protein